MAAISDEGGLDGRVVVDDGLQVVELELPHG
jgi:hypothetical protein